MNAIQKIEALGIKRLHGLVTALSPGVAIETVYRWRAAISGGVGVSDKTKRLLIDATAETDQAFEWDDFCPEDLRAGDPETLRLARAS